MPIDYEKELEKKNKELKAINDSINVLNEERELKVKNSNDKKIEILEIQTKINEVNKIKNPYETAFPEIKKDIDSFGVFSIAIDEIEKNSPKETKVVVGEIISKVERKLNPDPIQERTDYENAESEYIKAENDFHTKKATCDDLKLRHTKIKEKLDELKNLRSLLNEEKANDNKNDEIIYFLTLEINTLHTKVKGLFKTLEEFKTEANKAWDEFNKANDILKGAVETKKNKEAKWKEKQTELELLKKNRRQEIIKELREAKKAEKKY